MTKQSSIEKWSDIISDWEKSGISQKRYCEENEIKLSTFYYYRKKVSQQQDFVELPPPAYKPRKMIEIHLQSDDIKLRIPDGFSKQTLSALFDLLGVAYVS